VSRALLRQRHLEEERIMLDPSEQPVLSGTTGSYAARPPLGALREHFSCTWSNAIPDDGRPIAVVPDGAIDLEWIAGELRVAGPDQEVKCESFGGAVNVVGFRFRPGAASLWLGVPASEIRGARVPLDVFWGREACRIAERLAEARSPACIARQLEAALARRAQDMRPPDLAMSKLRDWVDAAPQHMDVVEWLGSRLGVSERTLRRRCHEAFGYGPKTLQRILRFQRFLELARRSDLRMAELASAAGYADQAHLTREARRMAGMTPAAVRQQLSR
jgi:AraC-like DNA-binding protein